MLLVDLGDLLMKLVHIIEPAQVLSAFMIFLLAIHRRSKCIRCLKTICVQNTIIEDGGLGEQPMERALK